MKLRPATIVGIICIIWIVSLVLIFIFVKKPKNSNQNEMNYSNVTSNENKETPNTSKSDNLVYEGMNIDDMYNENNIYIKNIDTNYGKYIEISNLVDSNLEKKINERIKDLFYKVKNEYNSNVNVYVTANYSDILSIRFVSQNKNKNEEVLNISLKDGSDLVFEQLYTSKDLVSNAIFKAIIYNKSYEINIDPISS